MSPATNLLLDGALVVCSLAGLGLSLYALRETARCKATGVCDVVLTHPLSHVFGFPNAVLAAAYFVATAALGADRLWRGPVLPLWPALAAAAASLAMTVYLAYALFFRLRAT